MSTTKCDRCGRPLNPWPLERGKKCSPERWVYCIRNDDVARMKFWAGRAEEITEAEADVRT